MTFPTEEQHAAAVIAALTAANAAPYDLDDISNMVKEPAKYGTLPDNYTEVTVSRRYLGDGLRSGGGSDFRGVRVTTRAVGTTVSNAREMRRRAAAALEDVSLTVAGVACTPVAFETEDLIAEDDGYYSGLTTWTYSA